MALSILPFVVMVIINASIPTQSIPVDLQVSPVRMIGNSQQVIATGTANEIAATPPQVATQQQVQQIAGFDTATITAVALALAGTAGGAWKAFKKSSGRDDATADTTLKMADSLKATDYGSADTARILAEALSQLSTVSPEISKALEKSNQAARQNAIQWNQDNKEYYENLPTAPRKGELEKDPVKTKLAQVNKITEKTSDPS